jgi:hypothetical protein
VRFPEEAKTIYQRLGVASGDAGASTSSGDLFCPTCAKNGQNCAGRRKTSSKEKVSVLDGEVA